MPLIKMSNAFASSLHRLFNMNGFVMSGCRSEKTPNLSYNQPISFWELPEGQNFRVHESPVEDRLWRFAGG